MKDTTKTSWDRRTLSMIETPEKVLKFLEGLKALCKTHNISISHEDAHGSFILINYSDSDFEDIEESILNFKE